MNRLFFKWKFKKINPELMAFLLGLFFLGINQGILNSTFNNYLHDSFHVDAQIRGVLELPREFPGFALILITGLLAGYKMSFWAVLVGLFSAIGVAGLGVASPNLMMMTGFMFLWSLADHLLMPIESAFGLALAKEGSPGKRLGQIAGARNFSMIVGALLVMVVMGVLNQTRYSELYLIGAASAVIAAWMFSRIKITGAAADTGRRFIYRREYNLYYVLNCVFGARKQIFLTFGPWVLVSEFGVSPQTIATSIMIAAAIGVVFRQYFGWATDKYGEQAVLMVDALILLGICLGYAFSRFVPLLLGLYVIDNLMFATRIARTTYLNRIAVDKRDLAPTLSLGVSIDHAVSATIPMVGGVMWASFGYASVFIAASGLALLNAVLAWRVGPKVSAR